MAASRKLGAADGVDAAWRLAGQTAGSARGIVEVSEATRRPDKGPQEGSGMSRTAEARIRVRRLLIGIVAMLAALTTVAACGSDSGGGAVGGRRIGRAGWGVHSGDHELHVHAGHPDRPGRHHGDLEVRRLDPAHRQRRRQLVRLVGDGERPDLRAHVHERRHGVLPLLDTPVHEGHDRRQVAGPSGSSARTVVPAPRALVSQTRPPSASTRSLTPISPEPPSRSAPPRPSSVTRIRRTPSSAPTSTVAAVASECLAVLVSISATAKYVAISTCSGSRPPTRTSRRTGTVQRRASTRSAGPRPPSVSAAGWMPRASSRSSPTAVSASVAI